MPRTFNYTHIQSYGYMLTPFTLFVLTSSHGGYHHPFSPWLWGLPWDHGPPAGDVAAPALSVSPAAPKIPLTHPALRRHTGRCPWTLKWCPCLLFCSASQLLGASCSWCPTEYLHCSAWAGIRMSQGHCQQGQTPLWWLLLPFHCLSLCHTCPVSLCISFQDYSFFVILLLFFNPADGSLPL